jgi:hypothetical protein
VYLLGRQKLLLLLGDLRGDLTRDLLAHLAISKAATHLAIFDTSLVRAQGFG